MKKLFLLGLSLFLAQPIFAQDHCAQYQNSPADYLRGVHTVALDLSYTDEQLCNLDRLNDIQIGSMTLYTEDQQAFETTWITLHYNEYSCQYFARNSDQVIVKKNCYNTW